MFVWADDDISDDKVADGELQDVLDSFMGNTSRRHIITELEAFLKEAR